MFNPSKCQVVRVTASRRPINTLYYVHGQVLEAVTSARYLGVDISSDLSWNSHIHRITGNANSILGFLKRNIKIKLPKVRETAYNTLVRPKLEYASPIWDPHTKDKISQIEKVQRRTARWTTSNYGYRSSVTSMIENIRWRTNKEGQMPANACFTGSSMGSWQFPFQTIFNPKLGLLKIATQ